MTDPLPNLAGPASSQPRLTRRKLLTLSATFVVLFIGLTLADAAIARAAFFPEGRDDWWRVAIKFVGDLRLWLVVGLVSFVFTRDWRWPAALVGSPALAGGLAELGKLLVGRDRPSANFELVNNGHYTFRPFMADFTTDFFSATNLGFPSSHAAAALGGVTMLAILAARFQRGVVLPAFALAGACCVSRVFAGAHFSTDVLAGAALGYLTAHAIAHLGDTMSKPKTP